MSTVGYEREVIRLDLNLRRNSRLTFFFSNKPQLYLFFILFVSRPNSRDNLLIKSFKGVAGQTRRLLKNFHTVEIALTRDRLGRVKPESASPPY